MSKNNRSEFGCRDFWFESGLTALAANLIGAGMGQPYSMPITVI